MEDKVILPPSVKLLDMNEVRYRRRFKVRDGAIPALAFCVGTITQLASPSKIPLLTCCCVWRLLQARQEGLNSVTQVTTNQRNEGKKRLSLCLLRQNRPALLCSSPRRCLCRTNNARFHIDSFCIRLQIMGGYRLQSGEVCGHLKTFYRQFQE